MRRSRARVPRTTSVRRYGRQVVRDPRGPVVAQRAVDIAAACGVTLPDHLTLWAAAGGRPSPSPQPEPGDPDELGALLEAELDAARRRTLGAHYTPRDMADGLAARALAWRAAPAVGDPACGGGALLLAAARHLAATGEAPASIVARLWGADIDPLAVATAEAALTLWAGTSPPGGHFVVADALVDALPWPPLDVVVGNPPFLSQLADRTVRPGERDEALRRRFGSAVRAYTDAASLFLLLGCDLARPGGTVAMLQPQSVVAARDTAAVRAAADERAQLREIWVPTGSRFSAAVDVCAPVLDVHDVAAVRPDGVVDGAPPAGAAWSAHLARHEGVPPVRLSATPTIGDEAEVTAAFRDEYYGLAAAVRERHDHPGGRPLITTGLIDLGSCSWGERPARIARRTWSAPVVDTAALTGRAAAWAARTNRPKLLVATQTKVVEVAVDDDGTWVAGVPVIVVLAPAERLWLLAAALSAPPVTAWVAERTAGTALSAGALKLTAALVRAVPLPGDADAWAVGAAALQAGDLDECAEAMTRAYASDDEVLAWWGARAKHTWPRATPVR